MRQLKELIRVNLLFANPQVTQKGRLKGKSGTPLIRSILSQYVLSAIIFVFVYGLIMIQTDFSKQPQLFTYFVALFSVLGLSQTINAIINVFLESKDLPAYLPLPFTPRAIFSAKLIVVSLTVVPFLLPIFVLFLLSGIKAQVSLILAVLIALVLFLLCLLFLYLISSLLVFSLARTHFYKKHKKIVTSALLFITTGLVIVGVLVLNQSDALETTNGAPALVVFLPLFYLTTQVLSLASLYSLIGLIGLLSCLLLIFRFFIFPRFYEELIEISTIQGNPTRKIKQQQSLTKLLWSYNLQLIKDPNLLLQVFSSSLVFPIIFFFSFGFSNVWNLSGVGNQYSVTLFYGGVLLSYLVTTPLSLVAILLSLDKENYLYIHATPISIRYYLRQKFLFGFIVQSILTFILATLAYFLFHMSLSLWIAFILGGILGSSVFSQVYFWRDFRLFSSHWTDLTQLFSRGSGTFGLLLLQFGGLVGGGLIIGGTVWLMMISTTFLIPLGLLLLLLIVASGVHGYFYLTYWKKV